MDCHTTHLSLSRCLDRLLRRPRRQPVRGRRSSSERRRSNDGQQLEVKVKHLRQADRRQDARLSGSTRSILRHRLKSVALPVSEEKIAGGAAPSPTTRQQLRRSSSSGSSFNRRNHRQQLQGNFDTCDVSLDRSFISHKMHEDVVIEHKLLAHVVLKIRSIAA